jgi:hypothetical protein
VRPQLGGTPFFEEVVMNRIAAALVLVVLALPALAAAQAGPPLNDVTPVTPITLSGPRFGVTYLGPGIQAKIEDFTGYSILPVTTQFGWQWETRFFTIDEGATGVSEWILLVGGLEQSHFLPSLTWIVGFRSAAGTEFGVGPNVSPAGSALAIAGGVTTRAGAFNLPVNVAVVPGKVGTRVSILVGFTTRSERGYRAEPPVITRPRVRPRSRPELPPFPYPGYPTAGCCRASL